MPTNQSACSSAEALTLWFQRETGRSLLKLEKRLLAETVNRLPWQQLVQLGDLDGEPLQFEGDNRFISRLDPHPELSEALPHPSETADLVLLLHALECSKQPHQLLRETERILRSGGYLLILSFNPFSLFGMVRSAGWFRTSELSHHLFFSRKRLKDWCAMINLEVIEEQSAGYYLPYHTWLNWVPKRQGALLERLFDPWAGAFYLLLVRKRLFPITPLRSRDLYRIEALQARTLPTQRTLMNDSFETDFSLY
jgi:SAM-dependent methyltransferase